jgi:hypothetical protein
MRLENVKSAINKLESIDHSKEDAYEKAILAYLTIKKLPVFIYQIPKGIWICRTRTHETKDFFKKVCEIALPPYNVIKDFARCNRPFQSKFYGGETRPTAFMELVENWAETKKIDGVFYVTTGNWITKNPLSAIIITSPVLHERTSDFDKQFGNELDKFIEQYDGEVKDAMILFYSFLSTRFRKEAKKDPLTYIITATYCNLALAYSKGEANCILYPSVPFKGQGINFAISADFITQENIELKGVMCNEFAFSKDEESNPIFVESNSWHAERISIDQKTIIW